MKKRIDFNKVLPAAYEAMDALDRLIADASVPQTLKELARIRASQINGCSYCVDAHTRDAKKIGEPEQKIMLVSAWREAGNIFSEEERLALQMTEEITLIHRHGLSDTAYEQAITLLGEEQTAELIMTIISINAWNRVGVATQLKPSKRISHLPEISRS